MPVTRFDLLNEQTWNPYYLMLFGKKINKIKLHEVFLALYGIMNKILVPMSLYILKNMTFIFD